MADDISYKYTYHFNFQDGSQKKIEINLDEEKYEMIRQEQSTPPEWTKLEVSQCSNCPLKSEQVPHCPVAVNLSDLVTYFTDHLSFEKVEIRIESALRGYVKETDLQDGIQSIYGLIMATSGCPHMNFLKPMAHFHLPFSNVDEAVARTISIYLLQQHYLLEQGKTSEVSLKTLENNYAQVNLVNKGISDRFSQLKMKDSSKNGVLILDAFASLVPWALSDSFKNFEYLFELKSSHKLDAPADK